MKIYLIRHATQQSILCNDNTSLSEAGKKQAEAIGNRLLSYDIDAIYSSDLLRAKETAEMINDVFEKNGLEKCPHEIRSGLREADFGTLTGHTDEDIAVTFHDFMESRYHTEEDWGYPEGENGQMVWERFEPVLNEILHSGYQTVAVVTHGGTIRCALSHLFGRGFHERLMFGKHFNRGSISEILYDESRDFFSLERFNDGAHLENREIPKNPANPECRINPESQDFPENRRKVEIHDNPECQKKPENQDHPEKLSLKNKAENSQKNMETKCIQLGAELPCILASGSPRRKELLERQGITPIILKSDADETYTATEPGEIVKELSRLKVTDVAQMIVSDPSLIKNKCPHQSFDTSYLMIGADTIVVSPDNLILGKPADAKDAYHMLFSLSGRTHSVHTGVTLLYHTAKTEQMISFSVKTEVCIAKLSPLEINRYIESGEPFDKAGGYGIQGSFAPYVAEIHGDYYNVVGLPIAQLRNQLLQLNIQL